MSQLAAAAQALNAPEALVQRSAEARAKVAGSSIDDVLSAWAGGGTVTAAAAPEAAPPEAAATSTTAPEAAATSTAAPEAAATSTAPPDLQPVEPAVLVAAAAAVPVAPIEAAPARVRVRIAGRAGALAGLILSVLSWVLAAQWMLPMASLAGPEGALRPVVELMSGRLVSGALLVSVGIGMLAAGLARAVPGLFGPGLRLVGPSAITSVLLGGIVGGVIGALIGGVVASLGQTVDPLTTGVEVAISVPVLGGLLWTAALWMGGGWLIGVLTQAVGVPAGVTGREADEVGVVKSRLLSAYGIPVMAVLTIGLLVFPVALVFINFPGYAPLVGVFVAASILTFAGLSTSRPGTRPRAGDMLVAVAGVAVVVLIVVAALVVSGAGHEGEAPAGEETTSSTEPEASALVTL